MRLSSRSFPHPVVGNVDDVPGAEFQATFDFSSDKTNFYLAATLICSSRTLQRMIKKKTACYTVHIECSNTLFRKIYDFDTETFRVPIPGTLVNDALEVNAFVRAKEPVEAYTVDGSHEDYAGVAFAIGPGDILAISDGQIFDANHEVDPLRRIGALIDIHQMENAGDHPMEAVFTEPDKIHIRLCEADFVAYREMKTVPHLTDHLTTTLVLPVLVEAIHLLGEEDLQEFKWAGLLQRRIDSLNLGTAADALRIAQALLNLPIRRALASAKTFLDRSGS